MIKRVPRPFEGTPYWPLIARYALPGVFCGGLAQTGVSLPTTNPDKVYLTRHFIPHAVEIKGLWLFLHGIAPAGSDPTVKVRIYAIDSTNGRPTQALGPEVTLQLPFTANTTVKFNFATPIRILKAQNILVGCFYNASGITGGTVNCSTFMNMGGIDGFSENYDIELTSTSLTYGGGLIADLTGLTSPSWTNVSVSSPANCNWALRCNPLDP